MRGGHGQCPCAVPRPCATPCACVTLCACAVPRPRAPHALAPAMFSCTTSIASSCPSCATPCPRTTPRPGAHPVSVPHHILVPRCVLVPVVSPCAPRPRAMLYPGACHVVAYHVHRILVPTACHVTSSCHAVPWCPSCSCATPPPRAHRVLESIMALCHATSSCHAASWRPSCPDAHLVLVALTTLRHATSSCRSSSSCLPRPCVHRILMPTASGAPWRHVPVPATSRLRVPPAAPAGLGAVPLLGDGSWPPTQDAASGAAAGPGAAVPHPGAGVPGGAGGCPGTISPLSSPQKPW